MEEERKGWHKREGELFVVTLRVESFGYTTISESHAPKLYPEPVGVAGV